MTDSVLIGDVLLLSLCESLLSQAETLELLATLVERDRRAALLDRAVSHREMATRLFVLGVFEADGVDE